MEKGSEPIPVGQNPVTNQDVDLGMFVVQFHLSRVRIDESANKELYMDFLVQSHDEQVIQYLQSRRATQIDPSTGIWGLRADSIDELSTRLADNAPGGRAWIAEIADFKEIS